VHYIPHLLKLYKSMCKKLIEI